MRTHAGSLTLERLRNSTFTVPLHTITRLPELPLDPNRDRIISVRPASCMRPPHTVAWFELPFLGSH